MVLSAEAAISFVKHFAVAWGNNLSGVLFVICAKITDGYLIWELDLCRKFYRVSCCEKKLNVYIL